MSESRFTGFRAANGRERLRWIVRFSSLREFERCSSCRGLPKCMRFGNHQPGSHGALPCAPAGWPPAFVHRVLVVPSGLDRPHGGKGRTTMSTNQGTQSPNPAAGTPQPAATLAPEQVVDQLRTMRTQIAEVTPLTAKQKK